VGPPAVSHNTWIGLFFHTNEETHSTPTFNRDEDEQKKSEEKYITITITKYDKRLHVNE
jgi:hypothetical protein